MYERLLTVASSIIGVSRENIGENSSQENVEYWDSFAHMNLILALEEEFDVSFTDVEITQIEKIRDIIDLLKKKNIAENEL